MKPKYFITHRFNVENSLDAYKLLTKSKNHLGILILYPNQKKPERTLKINNSIKEVSHNNNVVSFIGAGNYTKNFLIPSFQKTGVVLDTIVSKSGLDPTVLAKKYGFAYASTDLEKILNNNKSGSIVIATRHNSHAELIIECLRKNKNVFVEKPLCLTKQELKNIKTVYKGNKVLMVGFNRRFSPHVIKIKRILSEFNGPKSFIYTCNVGNISNDHWIQDINIGGGRLIGEACHFLDLIRFLAGNPIRKINLFEVPIMNNPSDIFSLQIIFEDDSIGTIHYFSNGNRNFPKERLEVFFSGKIICLDNFRKVRTWGLSNFSFNKSFKQNKGQLGCTEAFMDAVRNTKESPIPFNELIEVQEKIFEAMDIRC